MSVTHLVEGHLLFESFPLKSRGRLLIPLIGGIGLEKDRAYGLSVHFRFVCVPPPGPNSIGSEELAIREVVVPRPLDLILYCR